MFAKGNLSLKIATVVFGGLVAIPLIVILFSFIDFDRALWQHLIDTRLPELVWNTLKLAIGVAIGAGFLGTSLAWLVSYYQFPGRRYFEWLLILPLAMPGYVIGFVYLTSFEYQGVISTYILTPLNLTNVEIRSGWGVISVLSLVLYPYVYLMAKVAFQQLNLSYLEAAQNLGVGRQKLFFTVCLPMARPAIVAGISLALMESLADFGTVGLFTYDTFTTAIYDVWFGMFDRTIATQLASLLLIFNFLILYLELKTRGQASYIQTQGTFRKITPQKSSPVKQLAMSGYALLTLSLSFLFPIIMLLIWATEQFKEQIPSRFWELAWNSLLLGLLAAVIIIPVALLFAYGKRYVSHFFMNILTRIASLGYALPGSVVAVGVLIPLAWTDQKLNLISENLTGQSVGLIFTGSIIGILFAYSVRFMTVGFNSVSSSLQSISPTIDQAARNLGEGNWGVIKRIHLKMIRPGIITGAILILVDVMKEMPATLLLRPFGFDTMATWIWQLTSEAMVQEASLPALTIVISGMIPVLILIRMGKSKADMLH